MKLTEQKLKELIKEELQNLQEEDKEGKMAQGQLNRTGELASMIKKEFDVNTDLPEWVESKITKAEDYLSTVFNYMRGKDIDIEEANVTGNLDGGLGPPKTPFWGAASGSEGAKAGASTGYVEHEEWSKHHG